jgi:hypothetical protein
MSCDNPTGDGSFAAVNLPDEHIAALRDDATGWLGSLRSDLKTPEKLRDPDRTQREAEAIERLLIGLTTGHLLVPDEVAEAFLRDALESHDKENGYKEVVEAHDALHGLLVVLEGGES